MIERKKEKIINNILKSFRENKTFFISGHMRPDGDTIGSQLALSSYLKKKNKQVDIVNSGVIPSNLMFLPGANLLGKGVVTKQYYDVGIILECPDFSRLGNVVKYNNLKKIINIDHHQHSVVTTFRHSNIPTISLIDPKASSCAELVWSIMTQDNYKLTKNDAICFYTGIVTDTGKFQQANTTVESLQIAAELVKIGVDPVYIYRNVYQMKSTQVLKLLSSALGTLKTAGSIAFIKITKEMYKKCGAKEKDIDDFINYPGMIPNVRVFALFRELLHTTESTVKISLRSYGSINVYKIANKFGGGGHIHAAGFELKGNIESVIKKVLSYLKCEIGR